jgi:hypothetical protein
MYFRISLISRAKKIILSQINTNPYKYICELLVYLGLLIN